MTTCAVVIHYRTPDLAIACVQSLRATAPQVEVLLLDSASGDDSAAALESWAADQEHVTFRALPRNRGFGAGCNAGFEQALTTWPDLGHVLLINPDATVQPGCIEALLATARAHPEAAVVGGRVRSADGRRVLYENGRFRPWTLAASHAAAPAGATDFETEFVTGALMLVDAGLLRMGLRFDERYFLYVEDLDLCREVRARGRTLRVNLAAEVRHVEGASQPAPTDAATGLRPLQLYYVTRNKVLFARQRLGALQRWTFYLVAAVLKPLAGVLRGRGLGFLGPYYQGLRDGWNGRGGPR